ARAPHLLPTRRSSDLPSTAEPSKPMPSAKAPSSSAGTMATDFSCPSTSVNHSRMNRTSRSSTVLRTNSSCLVIRSAVPLLVVFVPLLVALASLLQSRACDFLGLVRIHAVGPVADQALLDGVRLEIEVVLRVRVVDILVESHGEPSLLGGVLHCPFSLPFRHRERRLPVFYAVRGCRHCLEPCFPRH